MPIKRRKTNLLAWAMAVSFATIMAYLLYQKHDAFQTRTYDFARFDQAVWNTLHGRFLFSSIRNMSILGNHFSPFLALLSPLFLIWNDARILFVIQAISVAVTGLFLFQIVHSRHPRLAYGFLLAFYLNPAIHEITLFEFRRVVPAMPFLAMALYGLYARRRWLVVVGLGLALLCKENVAFVVLMVGIYMLIWPRDWIWGGSIALLGGVWLVVVSVWVIPSFAPPSDTPVVYPQLYYFGFLGDSYGEMVVTLLRDPLILVRQLLDQERLMALWRTFLPLGIVLPLLAPDWLLISIPTLAYMLMSSEPVMYQLRQWHLATVMPVLFATIGIAMVRRSRCWAGVAVFLLVICTLIGYALWSPAPLGGDYEASLYQVTAHHRLARQIIDAIPPMASIATQPFYTAHLSHREHIYHYP